VSDHAQVMKHWVAIGSYLSVIIAGCGPDAVAPIPAAAPAVPQPKPEPASVAVPQPKPDDEVERQIALATSPVGGGPHQRESARAAAWLVEHAGRAYPAVLWRLHEQTATAGLVELSARFDRAESIEPLARMLAGREPPAWVAGQALARHSAPAARAALGRALASTNLEAAAIAADALGSRRKPAEDCGALESKLTVNDVRLRYHVVQAAAAAGCLDAAELEGIAGSDRDEDVRELARSRLESR
jgi:hypothetical protein